MSVRTEAIRAPVAAVTADASLAWRRAALWGLLGREGGLELGRPVGHPVAHADRTRLLLDRAPPHDLRRRRGDGGAELRRPRRDDALPVLARRRRRACAWPHGDARLPPGGVGDRADRPRSAVRRPLAPPLRPRREALERAAPPASAGRR